MNNAKYPSFVPDDCQSDFVDDDSYFVNYAEGHEVLCVLMKWLIHYPADFVRISSKTAG